MSRQNKVNPGMYTQRGRLTQDDAARELVKQRAIGSQQTWQAVQRDTMPNLTAEPEPDEVENDEQAAKPAKAVEKSPTRVKAAARKAPKTASKKMAPAKKATTAAKRGKAKSAKPAKAARTKAKSAKRRKS